LNLSVVANTDWKRGSCTPPALVHSVRASRSPAVLHPLEVADGDAAALARMSGTTSTPLSSRMGSASGDVGPLAPSTTTRARTLAALSSVIWFLGRRARGCHLHGEQLGGIHRLGALEPTTVLVSAWCLSRAWVSMPRSLRMAPLRSETATIRAPASCSRRAVCEPTCRSPDRQRGAGQRLAQALHGLPGRYQDAPPGGFGPPQAAAREMGLPVTTALSVLRVCMV